MSAKVKRRVSSGSRATTQNIINQMSTRKATSAAEFNPDYSPVIKGLKRIGVLAGIFIAILIGLTFILR
jgi:acid phosphatase family membrane protein YuiD